MLRVGPMEEEVCLLTTKGDDADFRERNADLFTPVRKLKDFQLKLLIKRQCHTHCTTYEKASL